MQQKRKARPLFAALLAAVLLMALLPLPAYAAAPNPDDSLTANADDSLTANADDSLTANADDSLTANADDSLTVNPDDSLTANADDSLTANADDSLTANADNSLNVSPDNPANVEAAVQTQSNALGGMRATSSTVEATVKLDGHDSFQIACEKTTPLDPAAVTKLKITNATNGEGKWTLDDRNYLREKFTNLEELDLTGYTGTYTRDQPFSGCTFTHVRLSANAVLSEKMFSGCLNLTTLAFGDKDYEEGVIDLTSYTGSYSHELFFGSTGIKKVRLPAVKPLSIGMFDGCSSLTELTVGEQPFTPGVFDLTGYTPISYGNMVFRNTGVTQVRLPAGAALSENMFYGCNSLTTLAVGSQDFTPGVIDLTGYTANSYGAEVFDSTNITQVRLPADIPLSGSMFNSCKSLTTLAVGDRNFTPGVIDLTDYAATSYGNMVFNAATGIRKVRLPAGVPLSRDMFWGCTSLTTLAVGDQPFTSGVVDLTGYTANSYDTGVFRGSGVTHVRLPATVNLSNSMFSSCTNLTTLVFIGGNTAPSVGAYAFYGVPANGTLYYPKDATGYDAAFSAALANWKRAIGLPPPPAAPTPAADGVPHVCYFGVWQYSNEHHWKRCSCMALSDYAPHVFNSARVCTVCGYGATAKKVNPPTGVYNAA